MTDAQKGLLAIAGSSTVWGLSGLYYKLLDGIAPLEILAHRTLWSLVFFIGLLAIQGRLAALRAGLRQPRSLRLLLLSSLMISINWFGFIFAISAGFATEASLGYYIFPLVAAGMGVLLLGERPGAAQWTAIALASVAVLILTIGLGSVPWIALLLASSFGIYGLIKRGLGIGPVVSVALEVVLLAPIALIYLVWLHQSAGAFGQSLEVSLLLAFSGVLTALPLVLFSYASKRLRMSTLGLVQYLNPTLQFAVAVLVFAEPFTPVHTVAFALIWTGLAIFTLSRLRQERRSRKAAIV